MATKETQLVKEKQNVPNKTRVGVSVCLLTAPSKVVTKASLRVPDGNLKKKNENIVWQRKKARAYEEKCLGELLFVLYCLPTRYCRLAYDRLCLDKSTPPITTHSTFHSFTKETGKVESAKRKTDSNISQSFGCWDLIG